MMRTLRRPLLLPLPALALTSAACGTERAHAGATADRAELEARARYMQSAIELIRVTEVDGHGDLPPVGDGAPNNSVPEGASG
ncbi:hypothetical protein [Streptomyces sp. NPDC059479]|uniref:hypothetical protein n=1 Tax=Streptomyces sp. NPDC059479 TaxID=3346848 RepID=UPI0036740ECF